MPIALWAVGVLTPAAALVVVSLVILHALIRGGFETVERGRDRSVRQLRRETEACTSARHPSLDNAAIDDLSPLYYPDRVHDLRTNLAAALVALEPE